MLKNAEKCVYTPPLGEKNGRPVLFPHKKIFCKPCATAGSFDRESERLGGWELAGECAERYLRESESSRGGVER